jgi:MFS family permease
VLPTETAASSRISRLGAGPRTFAALGYIAAYSAVGAAAPYFPVYYQSLGLTLDAIGLLAALSALTGLVAAPAWGIVSDRFSGARWVLPAACLASAAAATLLGLATSPVVAAICAVAYFLAWAGVGPLLDVRALETVGDEHSRFARLRVWGSVSFIVSTLIVGALIEQATVRALFVVLVGSILATALVAAGLRGRDKHHDHDSDAPRLAGLRAVVGAPALRAFVIVALLAWSSSTAINGFFSIYLVDVGAPESLVGLSWAIGAVVEIPLMVAFPMLARRFGLEALVVAGATFLLFRAVALVVVSNPLLVALTMTLHGVGFALLLVGGVAYAARHAPERAAATAQGVLAGVVFGLAQAVGPAVGGAVGRSIGIQQMFAFAALGSALAVAALAWVVLRPSRRRDVSERTAAGTARSR